MVEVFKSDTRPLVSLKKEVSMSSGLSNSAHGTVVELWLSVLFVCVLSTSLFLFEVIFWLKLLSKIFSFSYLSFSFCFFFSFFVFIFSSFFVIYFIFHPSSSL